MKKKIIYISNVNLDGPFLQGVIHKIHGQEKAFWKAGFEVDVLYIGFNNLIIIKKGNGQKLFFKGGREVNVNAPFYLKLIQHFKVSWYGSIDFTYCLRAIVTGNYDAVYLRFYLPGRDLVLFLKKVRKICPSIIVLLEYPTLSIKDLFNNSFVRKLTYKINSSRINTLNKYSDYIITLTKDKTLFHKPAIFMPNGIELSTIEPITVPSFNEQLVLLGVASDVIFSHGYDRVIRGLAAYRSKSNSTKVFFRLISNPYSKILQELKKITVELGIEEIVSFELPKTRAELTEVYKNVHVGIGTLAPHRIGLIDNYSLKHREYAAFGLPFIMSKGDYQFEDSPFVLTVERDEEPVDIQQIVDFYLTLRKNHPYYPHEFRKSVEGQITWDAQMKNIFDVINNR